MASKRFKTFENLTPAQQRVFERCAINDDAGINPRTAEKLIEMGYLEKYTEQLPGFPPVVIYRYFVPLPVHMRWAKWVSENFDEEGNPRVTELNNER